MAISWLNRSGWTITATAAQAGHPATDLIDGSTSTYWYSGASVTQSVTVDLGSAQEINVLRISKYGTESGDFPEIVTVSVSDNGTDWTALLSSKRLSVDSRTDFDVYLLAPVTKRWVKLTINGAYNGSWVRFSELNIGLSDPIPNPNGWTITASNWEATYPPFFASDEVSGTQWVTGANLPQSLIIDFGSAKTFSEVGVTPGANEGDRVTAASVYVSDDGASWGSAIASASGWSSNTARKSITFDAVTKRWLKITFTAAAWGSWGNVSEVDVNITEPPASASQPIVMVIC